MGAGQGLELLLCIPTATQAPSSLYMRDCAAGHALQDMSIKLVDSQTRVCRLGDTHDTGLKTRTTKAGATVYANKTSRPAQGLHVTVSDMYGKFKKRWAPYKQGANPKP